MTMKKYEQEAIQSQLKDEEKALKELKRAYKKAKTDVQAQIKALNARSDMQNISSIVHQKRYQEAILKQIDGVLDDLNKNQYKTMNDFMNGSYSTGYIANLYSLQKQTGCTILTPIDLKKVKRAVETDSQLSKSYYQNRTLPENLTTLKKNIQSEITRGIVAEKSWIEVAYQVASGMNSPFKRAMSDAMRIVRTEGHRINQQGFLDAGDEARSHGADELKQWDATLDSKTRPWHQEADGQIREWDDYFEVGGEKMKAPSIGGSARNVCNCRCQLLQRARWMLDEDELKTLQERASYFKLDKTKSFEEFKDKFLKASVENEKLSSMKEDVKHIQNELDHLSKRMTNLKSDLELGRYEEYKMNEIDNLYSDVSNLTNGDVKILKNNSEAYDKINDEYQTLYDKLNSMKRPRSSDFPDTDEGYSLYTQARKDYHSEREKLQNKCDELLNKMGNAITDRNKLRRYESYEKAIEKVKSQHLPSKSYLEKKLSESKTAFDQRSNDFKDLKIKMKGTPEYYDIFKSKVRERCENKAIQYRKVGNLTKSYTDSEIISRLGGGDKTEGSCSSLAFAYAGQKCGYDVLDFRDGDSRKFFATNSNIADICNIEGAKSKILSSHTPMKDALKLLDEVEEGKEYYFANANHASVVRRRNGNLEYLELQSGVKIGSNGYYNDWHSLDNPFGYNDWSIKDTLNWRFKTPKSKSKYQWDSELIEVDSLQGNEEFKRILGYINTAEDAQQKGVTGNVK